MARIRAFEEAAAAAVAEGTVLGLIHPYIGQEAIAVGVCANLTRDDLLLSTHRGHGHTLAKGASPAGMMCELLGRANGVCGGKGGSMHIADASVGMLGANGVVGANILIATGAAQAIKMQGQDRIVSCFFGDGAVNRGPFLEGLNWAAVFRLPVLFVCEDNAFSATTRTEAMTAGPGPAARAESLGVPAVAVDGNDVLAVDTAARDLVAAIRAGGGPRLLVARTYRLSGHVTIDPAAYRPDHEVQERWADDPIVRCADLLRQAGLDDGTLAGDLDAARDEIAAAYRFAKDSPWPDPREAFTDVQDAGGPVMEEA
ncbi:MAG: thiamine pyrophosphate-dependent dehydrogenase E1 component subunit alpha [Hyphomicrobiales bacterium]|nr:thiamine pyrophosphate-dependent dehydrogenase E1 component subunit alpha [Hyphomicrobiales bacterium]MCP5371564.1 thiamine pyrophosphate-dependent dehydrogenase E1 component subunit alpha [Hyphomicrobiales bacterium]